MKIRYQLFLSSTIVAILIVLAVGCKKNEISGEGPTLFTFQGVTYLTDSAICNYNTYSTTNTSTITSVSTGKITLAIVNQVPTGNTTLQPTTLCPACPYVTISSPTANYQAIGGSLYFNGSTMTINATMQDNQDTKGPAYPLTATVTCGQ